MKAFPIIILFFFGLFPTSARTQDFVQIKQSGVLRHLGVPYANFVKIENNNLSGMSVDIIRLFAKRLGVQYQFVQSDWGDIIKKLLGRNYRILSSNDVQLLEKCKIEGDLICTGLTALPWRKKIIVFSKQTFPTQVWAIGKMDNPALTDTNFSSQSEFKIGLKQFTILGKANTCLDPKLYNLNAQTIYFGGSVNDLALAIIEGKADLAILDCPDTLVALRKWPKDIKVIGPISEVQSMAVGFRPKSKLLKSEFDHFLVNIKQNGTYYRIVKKYYPDIFFYFPEAFQDTNKNGS